MPDFDDDLAALRDVNPVDPASVPSPTDPLAEALFERITMTDTRVPANAPSPVSPAPRPRWVLWAVAAAVVVIAAVAGTIVLDDDGTGPEPDDVANGSITPGGPSTASCVELYDLTTLANRDTAFDGTVQNVEGDAVIFAVNRWFRGGSDDQVSLNGASTLGGLTAAGDPLDLTPGTRLLVAGDGGFAWSCGFTQPYDEEVSDDWATAFGG